MYSSASSTDLSQRPAEATNFVTLRSRSAPCMKRRYASARCEQETYVALVAIERKRCATLSLSLLATLPTEALPTLNRWSQSARNPCSHTSSRLHCRHPRPHSDLVVQAEGNWRAMRGRVLSSPMIIVYAHASPPALIALALCGGSNNSARALSRTLQLLDDLL